MKILSALFTVCIAFPTPLPEPLTQRQETAVVATGTGLGGMYAMNSFNTPYKKVVASGSFKFGKMATAGAIGLAALFPGVRSTVAGIVSKTQNAGTNVGRVIMGLGRNSRTIEPIAASRVPLDPLKSQLVAHSYPFSPAIPAVPLIAIPIDPLKSQLAVHSHPFTPAIPTVPLIANPIDPLKSQLVTHSYPFSPAIPPVPQIANPNDASKMQVVVRPQVFPPAIISHSQIIKPIDFSKSRAMVPSDVLSSAPHPGPIAIKGDQSLESSQSVTINGKQDPFNAFPLPHVPKFNPAGSLLEPLTPFTPHPIPKFNPAEPSLNNLLTLNEFMETHQGNALQVRPSNVFNPKPLQQGNNAPAMLMMPFLRPIVKKLTTKNVI